MVRRSVDALGQDLHSALRRLRRAPGVSVLVISSLALGIGASTAIFSVARPVLFEPVPYRDADRVAYLSLYRQDALTRFTERQIATIQQRARSFERVEAYSFERFDWRRGDSTERLRGRVTTPGLPSAMEMRLLSGRSFSAEDGARGSEPVALISEELWRREFGGAHDIVGRSLILGDVHRTVVGVTMRHASRLDIDVWVPRQLDPTGDWAPSVIAWLRPGVTIEHARTELKSLSAELADRPGLLEVRLSRPGDRVSSHIDQMLIVFWGASLFLLAIVCANLANVQLARNVASLREFAIRVALGASWLRIIRLHLVETLLLAAAGGLGGLVVAMWATAAFLALRPLSLSLVYPANVALDTTAILYSLTVSVVAGLLVGVVPALRAARADPVRGFGRDDPHVQGAVSARWLFGGAVAAQAALAVVLLLGAGLMLSSYVRLMRVDPGFDPDNVVQVAVQLDSAAYRNEVARREFIRHLAERVGGLSGVVDVAIATDTPAHSTRLLGAIEIDGRPNDPPPGVEASWVHVTPRYFHVLRIPHIEGRLLAEADGHDGGVVVSQSFARRYWPGESAVGQRFRSSGGSGRWMHIVGVVGDVTGGGLRDRQTDEIYLSYATSRTEGGSIVARIERKPADVLQAMKEQVWALDPNVPIGRVGTLRQVLARSIDEQTFYATLLGASAFIALILAAVGVFGVTSYAASQRRREIGIRIALGAQAVHVERFMALQGLVPSLIGIAAGLAGGLALSQFMRSLVHEVSVTDPAVYIVTAVTLGAVSVVATWLPSRRASRVDPMLVLRDE